MVSPAFNFAIADVNCVEPSETIFLGLTVSSFPSSSIKFLKYLNSTSDSVSDNPLLNNCVTSPDLTLGAAYVILFQTRLLVCVADLIYAQLISVGCLNVEESTIVE